MRILLAGVHFFSSFAWSVKKALQRLDHEVIAFDYRANPFARIPKVRTFYYNLIMQRKLLYAARLADPDLIILCKGELIHGSTVESLRRRHDVPVVNWFSDARLYSYERIVESMPLLDRFYTKNQEDIRRARFLNWNNVIHLAHCADVELHGREMGDPDSHFQADLSFVGACYPYRDLLMSQLASFDLKVWGSRWRESALYQMKPESVTGREARGFDQSKVFHHSVVNLNLHHFDDVHGLNQRFFDVCASGGFQIVDYKEEIEEYYEIGKEIETFSSTEELKDKIRFYLDNRQKAAEIGLRAREKTLKHHTYEHRVQSILSDVFSLDNIS
jgi:spore maturation protein CgeB